MEISVSLVSEQLLTITFESVRSLNLLSFLGMGEGVRHTPHPHFPVVYNTHIIYIALSRSLLKSYCVTCQKNRYNAA